MVPSVPFSARLVLLFRFLMLLFIALSPSSPVWSTNQTINQSATNRRCARLSSRLFIHFSSSVLFVIIFLCEGASSAGGNLGWVIEGYAGFRFWDGHTAVSSKGGPRCALGDGFLFSRTELVFLGLPKKTRVYCTLAYWLIVTTRLQRGDREGRENEGGH